VDFHSRARNLSPLLKFLHRLAPARDKLSVTASRLTISSPFPVERRLVSMHQQLSRERQRPTVDKHDD
jgi:hypothetical protein